MILYRIFNLVQEFLVVAVADTGNLVPYRLNSCFFARNLSVSKALIPFTGVSPTQLIEAVMETLNVVNLREEITRMKTLLPLYDLGLKFISAESEQAVYAELVDAVVHELGVPSVRDDV